MTRTTVALLIFGLVFAPIAEGATSINPILYGYYLFQSDLKTPKLPSYQTQFDEIKNAGFTTLVLWDFHVTEKGDIIYNNTPCITNGTYVVSTNGDKGMQPNFTQYVNSIKSYGTVKKIYLSLGWGEPIDYDNFMKNQKTATNNFKVLLSEWTAVDGFDLDYEGEEDPKTVTTITRLLGVELNKSITFCPYVDETAESHARAQGFWLPVLASLYKTYKYQPVQWFNLQCYAGGDGNSPQQWVDAIAQYPGGAKKVLGIDDPAAFIAPGYWVASQGNSEGQCPNQLNTTYAGLQGSNITAGFLWNSQDMWIGQSQNTCGQGVDLSPAAYANAIVQGLSA